MSVCTAVNCMDGRTQLPVIHYLKKRFNVKYVDIISEPGPNAILAKNTNSSLVKSILDRIEISLSKNLSVGIAVVGHHDCKGNPEGKEEQISSIWKAKKHLRTFFNNVEIIGLWVNEKWEVEEITHKDLYSRSRICAEEGLA